MVKLLDAPLKWHGGKSYLAQWICDLIPEHTHYVETHAGGLAVLFRNELTKEKHLTTKGGR